MDSSKGRAGALIVAHHGPDALSQFSEKAGFGALLTLQTAVVTRRETPDVRRPSDAPLCPSPIGSRTTESSVVRKS